MRLLVSPPPDTTSAAPSAGKPRSGSACRRCATRRLGALDGVLERRVRHVVSENARVEATARALRTLASVSWRTVARLLDESHASLRDDYEASVPEVETTVEGLEGRRSRRRPDGRRRLRRLGARAATPRSRPAGGCPCRRSPRCCSPALIRSAPARAGGRTPTAGTAGRG